MGTRQPRWGAVWLPLLLPLLLLPPPAAHTDEARDSLEADLSFLALTLLFSMLGSVLSIGFLLDEADLEGMFHESI